MAQPHTFYRIMPPVRASLWAPPYMYTHWRPYQQALSCRMHSAFATFCHITNVAADTTATATATTTPMLHLLLADHLLSSKCWFFSNLIGSICRGESGKLDSNSNQDLKYNSALVLLHTRLM